MAPMLCRLQVCLCAAPEVIDRWGYSLFGDGVIAGWIKLLRLKKSTPRHATIVQSKETSTVNFKCIGVTRDALY